MNNLVLTSSLSGQLAEQAPSTSAAYLSFQLTEGLWAALPMDQVHEVLAVSPQQITPMFNMPPCVWGLLTRRSRILWTVDLSHLLLNAPLSGNSASSTYKHAVVIVRVNLAWAIKRTASVEDRILLGLVVREVKGSTSINTDAIQAPQGHFSADFAPCLKGSVLQADKLLHVLDAEAIARSPVLEKAAQKLA